MSLDAPAVRGVSTSSPRRGPRMVFVAMPKSPLLARKVRTPLSGAQVSSGTVTSLVMAVAHPKRLAVGAGVME
jgi:hypothetical protein